MKTVKLSDTMGMDRNIAHGYELKLLLIQLNNVIYNSA